MMYIDVKRYINFEYIKLEKTVFFFILLTNFSLFCI